MALIWKVLRKFLRMKQDRHLKIFALDENPFCLTLYEQLLRNIGFTNITCFENRESFMPALTHNPEIIFLDHNPGNLNGIEILKSIKRYNPDIYVVFLSANEDEDISKNTLEHGAFHYIIKGKNDLKEISYVMEKILYVKKMLGVKSA